jgi:FkbM family methyltransferase
LAGFLKSQIANPNITFMQVGTNIAIGQPVESHIKATRKCILVEPIPSIAEGLKKKYSAPNYFIENVGISDKKEKLVFYSAESETETVPEWVSALNSFKKFNSDWLKETYKDIEIKETLIETSTIAELVAKHNLTNINILQIDTEGYDYIILQSIDFNKTKIDLIIFEDVHLSAEEKLASKKLLNDNNYEYFSDGHDTIGYHKDVYKYLLK